MTEKRSETGDGPVFDYTSSAPWEQVIRAYGDVTDVDEAVREMVADGLSKDEAWEAIWDYEVRRFEHDPAFRTSVRDIYRTAGVDLLSVTPWTHDSSISERAGQRRDLARWQSRFDSADWLRKVTSPEQARRVAAEDDVGIVLNTQNVDGAIDGSLADIDVLYNEGVRLFQLTYNYQNRLATGCNDPAEGGLSKFGRAAVDRINELGGIVDISHCGKQTTLDTIEYSDKPVAVTHATCQAVAQHYRGKTDQELEALSDADGYIGIVTLPWFIAPGVDEPTLDIFLEHLAHAVSIVGADNVGLGTDFYPADSLFPPELLEYYKDHIVELGFDREKVEQRTIAAGIGEFETYGNWPVVRQRLEERFPEAAEGILGENFLDFWERSQGNATDGW
ncbi:dipeptidase [Halopenitus persicus]|uniref:Membrane dipeptidase n=1 Tax=Halopenitus persicus TaxID=1048396 RepID=A0A1H3K2Z2_9EURY|nr:membrane dipeptidase [Halopenitus persicus]SDY45968.1 membrane dipeptidase [Halopenitus persicus]